uniref:B30.2/SPRY domain-containing protein n=1 Tax=Maylandia zebra TaxID=106582 RepID=A0A3P9D3U8_9CICH
MSCNQHQKESKLFCVDEQRAVCPVCEFSLHQSHKVVPVEEAVSDLKEQLKSDLKSLQDKRNKYKQVEETYNEMREHMKKQLLSTESREMKMIEEQISSLSDSISAVEEELQKHSVPFLSSYKDTQSRARAQSSVSDPQLVSGALIDVAKHLGNLSFRVWEKMKEKVHFSPVILDPNTAYCWLYLSDDLTSVRQGDTGQQLPDNPERNTYYITVFGYESFSSGKHSWDVEVGDHPSYFVGLAKESLDRKGMSFGSPDCGFWCLLYCSGKYFNRDGQTLTLKKSLQRIRVQLDYDRGEVSFYDPEDMTHIYTHRDTFTEKLFPYFSALWGRGALLHWAPVWLGLGPLSLAGRGVWECLLGSAGSWPQGGVTCPSLPSLPISSCLPLPTPPQPPTHAGPWSRGMSPGCRGGYPPFCPLLAASASILSHNLDIHIIHTLITHTFRILGVGTITESKLPSGCTPDPWRRCPPLNFKYT